MAAADQLNGINNLLTTAALLQGKNSTTKSTQTTGNNITPEGLQLLMDRSLSGPGGVKDIANSANGAGLFNSSASLQLQNDLQTRVAGEAAARSATTTTSNTTQTKQPGLASSLGGLALPILAMGLGKKPLDLLADGFSSIFGTGATATPAVGGTLASSFAGGVPSVAPGLTLAGQGTAIGGAGASIAGSLASSLGGSATTVGNVGATSALSNLDGLTGAAGQTAGDALASGAVNTAAGSASSSVVPFLGTALSSLAGGGVDGTSMESFMGAIGAGAAAAGPLGMLGGVAAMTFGDMLSDLGVKSVVCTALAELGVIPPSLNVIGQAYAKTLSPYTRVGYYHWGVPMSEEITKQGREGKLTMRAFKWAISRLELLSAKGKFVKYFRYPRGTLTLVVGQPCCWLLGYALSKLYSEVVVEKDIA